MTSVKQLGNREVGKAHTRDRGYWAETVMGEIRVEIPRDVGGVLQGVHYTTGGLPRSTPLVILCHGFTGDKEEWGRFPKTAKALNDAGFDAVLFDFSGSGQNPREAVTLTRQIQDLEDVYRWVLRLGYQSIGTIGLSFGGLTSLLAKLPERRVAVFWAPAFYPTRVLSPMQRLGVKILSMVKQAPLKRRSRNAEPILIDRTFVDSLEHANSEDALRAFVIPALIVQGTDDATVKARYSRDAYSVMPRDEHHQMVEVEGADHNFDGEHLDRFIMHSIAWLKRYL